MNKQINKKKFATTSMVVLGIGLIVGGTFATLNDTLTHDETITIEWVDIVNGEDDDLALEDVNDVTNTPVTELTPGITYELTGTLENDSTVVTNWTATDLTTTPGMTVTIADANGNESQTAAYESVDVAQFGITVKVDQTITPSTELNFEIQFSSSDARSDIAPPTLAQPTAISAVFADPALATCIANDSESGANGDVSYIISQEVLNEFYDIDCQNMGITNIEGIQYFNNLKVLKLNNNEITDITLLSSLGNLKTIYLPGNNITDITPLAQMNGLTYLDLNNNQITDISAVTNLTNLKTLYLSNNQINDFNPLSGLTNLTSLQLTNTGISDLTPLANLTNLKTLVLNDNQISDISPLSQMYELTYLDLGANKINDLTPLSNLVNLEKLWLASNEFTDITPLANLTNLTHLSFYNNNISDISVVANFTNLVSINLGRTNVTDFSPLANLSNLETLSLYDANVTEVTEFANLAALTTLDLAGNNITDFSSLSYKPTTFKATGQSITLPDTTLGTPTDIIIDGINGEDLIITWNTPGTYVNGQLTWENPGVNSLTFASADGTITGTITQTVI